MTTKLIRKEKIKREFSKIIDLLCRLRKPSIFKLLENILSTAFKIMIFTVVKTFLPLSQVLPIKPEVLLTALLKPANVFTKLFSSKRSRTISPCW